MSKQNPNETNNQTPPQKLFGNVEYTPEERLYLQSQLDDKLDESEISKRQGPGGGEVSYLETWRAIELANKVLGFNGWSSSVVDMTQDFLDSTPGGKFSCGYSAIVCVSLKDGSFHEDIGYGTSENQKTKGVALANAKKNAVSDALKRSLRNFGNQLGLTIYDREHIKVLKKNARLSRSTNNVPKVKPVNPHFDKSPPPKQMNGNVQVKTEESSQTNTVMNNNQNGSSTPPVNNSKPLLIPTTTNSTSTNSSTPLIPIKSSPSLIPVKVEQKLSPPLIPTKSATPLIPTKSSAPLIPVGKRTNNSQTMNDPKKRKFE
eukprot:gene1109-10623_t